MSDHFEVIFVMKTDLSCAVHVHEKLNYMMCVHLVETKQKTNQYKCRCIIKMHITCINCILVNIFA